MYDSPGFRLSVWMVLSSRTRSTLTTNLPPVLKTHFLTTLPPDAFRTKCLAAQILPFFRTDNTFRRMDLCAVMVVFSTLRPSSALSLGLRSVLVEAKQMIRNVSTLARASASKAQLLPSIRRIAPPAAVPRLWSEMGRCALPSQSMGSAPMAAP